MVVVVVAGRHSRMCDGTWRTWRKCVECPDVGSFRRVEGEEVEWFLRDGLGSLIVPRLDVDGGRWGRLLDYIFQTPSPRPRWEWAVRLASTRSRYFSRWRRHAPPPPFLPLGGHAGFEEPRYTGLAQIAGGGGGGGGGGWGTPSREKEERGAKYKSKGTCTLVTSRFCLWEPGAEHTGGVSSRLRNGGTAFAVGRRVSGRVPWPRNPLCAGAF